MPERFDLPMLRSPHRCGLLLLALLLLALASIPIHAQDIIASSGQDFYTTLPWLEQASAQSFRVTIAASKLCTVTVTFTESGRDTTMALRAGERWDLMIPRDSIVLEQSESVSRRTLHITSTAPVTVNATHDAPYIADAFLVLPTQSLGFEYFAIAHPTDTLRFEGVIAVVATENGTTIRITPTAQTSGGTAGSTYTRTLQRGDVYQILPSSPSHTDLTGTRIRSDKPVAVISGHRGVTIAPLDAFNSIVEQMVPTVDWGMTFYATSLPGSALGYYRVFASRAGTEVFANGRRFATLGAGEHRFFTVEGTVKVEATAPITLVQYTTHFTAARNEPTSDPSMMIVNPTESYATSFLWGTASLADRSYPGDTAGVTRVRFDHYLEITAPTSALGSVRLDGAPVTFTIAFDDGLYAAAIVQVAQGAHTLTASAPVNAQLFGYSDFDAYAMPAGMRLRDAFRGEPLIARTCRSSIDTTITLTNVGVEQIDISSILFSPGITGAILSPSFYPYPVSPNTTVQIRLRIDLPNFGALHGRLVVNTTTSGGRPLEIPIEVSRDSIAIDILESVIRFPSATAGSPATDTVIAVVNTGTGPTTISGVSFTGPFSLLSPNLPVTLSVGDTLRLRVRFSPSATGDVTGRIIILQPSCGRPDTALLAGRRLRPAAISAIVDDGGTVICPDPGTLDIPVTIHNPGEEPLMVDSLELRGAAPGDYRLIDPPIGRLVAPDSILVAMVRFVPTRTGDRPAVIRIWNRVTPGGYLLVPITARKDSVALVPSRSELDFGATSGCQEAPARELRITNSGTLPVGLDSARFASGEFRIEGALPASIAAGESTTVTIRFAPRGSGPRFDTLRIHGDRCTLVATVTLQGEQRGASLATDVDTIDFGVVPSCRLPATRTITLLNTGAVVDSITSISVDGGGYRLRLADSTLAPGEEVAVEIEFTGESSDAVLTIAGAPCALRRTIVLRGRTESVTLAPIADIDLGTLSSGTPKRGRTTLANPGVGAITIDSISFTPAGARVVTPLLPLVIAGGERREIEMEYMPVGAGPVDMVATVHVGAPCAITGSFRIMGRGEEDLSLLLRLPDTTASIDERLAIPIEITSSRAMPGAIVIEGSIGWNRTMLLAGELTTPIAGGAIARLADTTIAGLRSLRFRYSGPVPEQGVLAHIPMLTLLGTTDTTALRFAALSGSSTGEGIRVGIAGDDGGFRTLGICRIGGDRFIRLGAAARMERIAPNPMSGSATVTILLPEEADVTLRLYDGLGRMSMLFDGRLTAGRHHLPIERGTLASGLYRIEMESNGRTVSEEVVIAR
jgi:hypothetical protein